MEQEVIQLAGCIITDDYGRLLLLHRETDQYQHWELPGGKVEEGESPEQAAIRELHEELGVTVVLTGRACVNDFEDGEQNYKYTCFTTEIAGGELMIKEAETFNDFDYIDIEDLASLSLSENMLVLQNKIFTGDVALEQ